MEIISHNYKIVLIDKERKVGGDVEGGSGPRLIRGVNSISHRANAQRRRKDPNHELYTEVGTLHLKCSSVTLQNVT